MRQERHFLGFVLAWSVVSVLNEALNGFAADLESLTSRGVWLGLLFLAASVLQCLRIPVGADQQACQGAADRICAALYLALFLSTGLPTVAWRCLNPTDLDALNGLRHGASIAFELGLLTLLLIRVLSALKGRGLLTAQRPR